MDKISEEWVVIHYFREKYKLFPKGKLVKSESPDFVLQVNRKKRIGIELTRFDRPAGKESGREEAAVRFTNLMNQKAKNLPEKAFKRILADHQHRITGDFYGSDE